MKKEALYKVIIFFALAGLLISAFLTYNHYAGLTTVCLPGQQAKCDIVLKGPYATTFGDIPNSLIGALGFGLILVLALTRKKNKNADKQIFYLSLLATLFVIYLIYLIYFVIKAFCMWCFFAWICIIGIFISSWIINRQRAVKAIARKRPAKKTKRKVAKRTTRKRKTKKKRRR